MPAATIPKPAATRRSTQEVSLFIFQETALKGLEFPNIFLQNIYSFFICIFPQIFLESIYIPSLCGTSWHYLEKVCKIIIYCKLALLNFQRPSAPPVSRDLLSGSTFALLLDGARGCDGPPESSLLAWREGVRVSDPPSFPFDSCPFDFLVVSPK